MNHPNETLQRSRHNSPNRSSNRSSRRRVAGNRQRKRFLSLECLEHRSLLAVLVADVMKGTADTAIVGTVYEDLNSNGVKDNGESGIPGWTVYLDLDNSGTLNTDASGTPEPSAITNQDGDFVINHLVPGNYRIAEVTPDGWVPTAPISQDVVVTQGKDTRADFFNFSGGQIAGTVWNDLNGDGVRAGSPGAYTEPGLAHWTVYLDLNTNRALDPGEPSTLTDEAGNYLFSDIPPGDYEVSEVLPAGWDVSPTYDTKQTATVIARTTVTQDFANFSLTNGSIQGAIWNDTNANGVRDTDPSTGAFTEPGLEGWTVFLDTNNNGALDVGETSTVTDKNGVYSFLGLAAGDYEVTELLPPAWDVSPTYDVRQTVTVAGGEVSVARDFSNFTVLNGSIHGTVWNDVNRNSKRDVDALTGAFLDPGLANWSVFLDLNRNLVADVGEPTTLTDANGNYTFTNLQVGDYEVHEVLPAGWETSPTFSDSNTVTVFSGVESTAPDFANFNVATASPGSVSGTVWNDANGNGLRETGEPGLTGWTVFVDANGDGVLSTGEASTTTLADGSYSISGIPTGSTTIVVQQTVGWRATAPISHSRSIALKSGDNVVALDFGETELKDSSISGVVFADTNRDGIRETAERGLAGITVYLDLNGNSILDADEPQTQTSADLFYTPGTDEAGAYSFTHLAKGTYTVREIIPSLLASTPATELEHVVTLGAAEDHSGVNSAAVFRPNELHGVKFDDANRNHIRDAGEAGIGGITIYVDLNRNNVLDAGEQSTVTLADGSYSFTNMTPGAYVIREVAPAGTTQTSPTTVGGTLWPSGTSNPAVGDVTPLNITASLAAGESLRQTVTLTMPKTGALTNLVDVFLLFDDTGSFVNNSPIVRSAFPDIIANLQSSLPGIDLGFGVGRFEEYANFAYEYATGRPFVLNQPIVATSTSGYMTAIQSALNRTTPGYGGDQPETDIEALYQLVTGKGFDGNNNGSVLDSGAAGLASTQLNPGGSGDVPSFASFTADPARSVMPAAGNTGGAGFRAGALPIVLLATDTGFAYQPKGETSVTGVGGLTLPISALTGTSRPTTPFNSGAGLQETVTALNALGALVIGLGTNGQNNLDPRQGLEAISNLTGATNHSTATIANGTADPIAPGDPFYFQIASGFGASVANGVTAAIQNAVTNVAMDLTIQASDPRVHIINHTGVLHGVGAGATASFDIEFTGDGIPHRFDLQFVRSGTNVVVGSIPVVLGTPISGDGYAFEDLEDGEIGTGIDFGNTTAVVDSINTAPTFTKGADVTVLEDAGLQTITTWATNISPGPAREAGQTVDFVVENDHASLFATQPTISADGTLTFSTAANAFGTATISVVLHDNGGTLGGGVDTSARQTFTITVTPVNDPPVATADTYTTAEDTSLVVAASSGVLSNDTDVENDPLTTILVTGPSHGEITLNSDGSFSYVPNLNYNGPDSFTYKTNDGVADSNEVVVSLTVTPVNDPPVATSDTYTTVEDTSLVVVASSGVLSNDTDVENDPLTAILVTGPSHGVITLNSDGSFSYVPDLNYNGPDSFTYKTNDGIADSNIVAVSMTITPVNDPPVGVSDSYQVSGGQALVVSAATGVLVNDSDFDGDRLSAVLVGQPQNGTLTLNSDGSFTYIANPSFVGSDSFTYVASDGILTSNLVTVNITVTAPTHHRFIVVDGDSHTTFHYDESGNLVTQQGLDKKADDPRGIAANKDGSLYWVVDADGRVFVHNASGRTLGSWVARGIDRPEGIATNGKDLWIVDRETDRVYFFAGGAARRTGSVAATSSFALAVGNRKAMDLATDGVHIWVVNDTSTADKVFRYSTRGTLEGSWQIDAANSRPTGVTIDPNNVDHIWIVDAKTSRVYQYSDATNRISGRQNAELSFALDVADSDPQGIADPQAIFDSFFGNAANATSISRLPTVSNSEVAHANRAASGIESQRDAAFATLFYGIESDREMKSKFTRQRI